MARGRSMRAAEPGETGLWRLRLAHPLRMGWRSPAQGARLRRTAGRVPLPALASALRDPGEPASRGGAASAAGPGGR
jgi:hypothetical protein